MRYVSIREDHGIKSLSNVERNFIRSSSLRVDGREMNQIRSQQLCLSRWDNGSSVTVIWGNNNSTRVSSTCTAELIPPNPDRPSEGMVSISVDLSPSASTSFRHAAPSTTGGGASTSSSSSDSMRRGFPQDEGQKLTSNRILRCLERVLLTGGALDTEALCVTPGSWVWRLHLKVTVVDAGGNLLDASVLACMASLRHYRKPHVQLQSQSSSAPPTLVPADLKEPTPLPIHHTPLAVSFGLIPQEDSSRSSTPNDIAALIDPTDREELVATGSLTIAMNIHGEVCLLDYGGGSELPATKLRDCWVVAEASVRELCQNLEKTLTQADELALQERLERLQRKQHGILPESLPRIAEDLNFYQVSDHDDDFMRIEQDEKDSEKAQEVEDAGEEEYRKQALDYNIGHIPTKVREKDDRQSRKQDESALLAAMLKSVQDQSEIDEVEGNDTLKNTMSDKDEDVQSDEKEPSGDIAAKGNKAKTSISKPTPMNVDSDEEETIMQLTSEFDAVPIAKKVEKQEEPVEKVQADKVDDEEDDVDDLAAAIKKKKKKKKK